MLARACQPCTLRPHVLLPLQLFPAAVKKTATMQQRLLLLALCAVPAYAQTPPPPLVAMTRAPPPPASCFHSNYVETFSNTEWQETSGWLQATDDDLDFFVSTETPTAGTGPLDPSPGSGSWFLFSESSGKDFGFPGKVTAIQTCSDDVPLDGTLLFYYSMNGANMGELRVYVEPVGKPRALVFKASGDQGSAWRGPEMVCLYRPGQRGRIRIEAVSGSGELSDIALDDLAVSTDGSVCSGTAPPAPPLQSPEQPSPPPGPSPPPAPLGDAAATPPPPPLAESCRTECNLECSDP